MEQTIFRETVANLKKGWRLSLLDRVKSFFTQKKRAFYEGGRVTKANRDFWNANSPFETTASPDRDTLRARARWLHENNPIMANIDKTIINNVIGRGIKLQLKTENLKFNEEIENLWRVWGEKNNCDISGRFNFSDLQALILEQRMVDGEIFIYKRYTDDKNFPFKLQLIEADRVYSWGVTDNLINGIEIDNFGKPKYYNFINKRDYEYKYEPIKVKADEIIHYYKAERATQYRGISEYKQAILDIKNFAAFQSATIASARARANIAYYVEQEGSGAAFGVSDDEEFEQIQEINGVMVYYLKRGEKLGKLDPTVSMDNSYSDFVSSVIRLIAVARNVSYELAFRDFSKVNFSSARASIIQDNKRFDLEQRHIIDYVLQPIFEAWLEAMFLSGKIKSVKLREFLSKKESFLKTKWIPPVREWVDPLKDMRAIELELKLGLTTKSEVCASRGKDYEDVLLQLKKEQELEKKYSIKESDEN